jgi:hypothetical protein
VHDRRARESKEGNSLRFDIDSISCGEGKRYPGFTNTMSPTFEHFLSCGIPGKIEGERYKKSPETVRELMKLVPQYKAPARFLAFKKI